MSAGASFPGAYDTECRAALTPHGGRSAPACTQPCALLVQDLGVLMPMFLLIDQNAVIQDAGPTMRRLLGADCVGQPMDQYLCPRSPASVLHANDVLQAPRLRFVLQADQRISLKGVAARLGGATGALINLSFGYSLPEAVRQFSLSEQNFAPTDLAIELLYLIEVQALVQGENERIAGRLRSARKLAERRARTDPLTGLANRRALDEQLAALLETGPDFCLLHVDLDYFKQVNDTLGHAAGDHVLGEIAALLRSTVRGVDVVARVGGDEFTLLLRGLSDVEPLHRIGERLLQKVAAPLQFQGQPCAVGLSMGAVFAQKGEDLTALMEAADEALYASKRAGRRRLTLSSRSGQLVELVVGKTSLVERRRGEPGEQTKQGD